MKTQNFNLTMKHALLFVVIFVIIPLPGNACLPDCFDDEWGVSQTEVINLEYLGIDIDCEVEVTYRTRKACGVFDDVIIDNIDFLEDADCPFDLNDQTTAFNVLSTAFVIENPMEFDEPDKPSDPAGPPNCTTGWRIIHGSCWFNIEDQTFQPCEIGQDDCCLEPYRFCIDACGNKSAEGLGPEKGQQAECEPEWCDLVCG